MMHIVELFFACWGSYGTGYFVSKRKAKRKAVGK